MSLTVLITDKFSMKAEAILLEAGYQIRKSQKPNCYSEDLKGVHVLAIRSKTKINKELLQNAPDLKLIVTATSGFDHIDFVAAHEAGVKLAFTPEANAASAAELTWSLVLACARSLIRANQNVHTSSWSENLEEGIQLAGKTYGIIGLGRIGRRVAKIANAFGMNVIAYDPYAEDESFALVNAKRLSFDEVLRLSDIVSLHVPFTKETKRMINLITLEAINHGAIFVNTSRGAIVDEVDLCEAIKKGWVAKAGLDVFVKEPIASDSCLLKSDKIILTPHIGAKTTEAYELASIEAAKQILSFFKSGDLAHPLPPTELWYTTARF